MDANTENTLNEPDPLSFNESCMLYLDTMMYCFTPANQFSNYYRVGYPQDCTNSRDRFMSCLKLKFRDLNPEERSVLIKQLRRQDEFCPTSKIWEFRKSPKDDWNSVGKKPSGDMDLK